ncbi:MAG: cytochrome P450 [Actinobacteria bacterium]|nr:cytochrome P450 [Actinomycetota bacterium]
MPFSLPKNALGPFPDLLGGGSTTPVERVRTPAGDAVWLVRDYTLARQVLTDPRFSRAAAVRPDAPKLGGADLSPASIMSLDGDDHTRLRRIVTSAFSTGRVARLRPFVVETAGQLLASMAAVGPTADLIESFAAPLPVTVLGTLLGVPVADRQLFGSSISVVFDMTASTGEEKSRQRLQLVDYMITLIEAKRSHPGDDLMSGLVAAHRNGQLSRTELISLGLALLTAGYETTVGQLGLSVLALLRTSDPLRFLEAESDLETLIEELLRTSPATPASFPRVATEDLRLGHVMIRSGDAVMVSFLDGNRDEQVFPEPARVGSTRTAAHLTFGHGVHRCLGAPLARLQLHTALELLFRRYPSLRLAPVEDAVVWKSGLLTRGLASLRVQW